MSKMTKGTKKMITVLPQLNYDAPNPHKRFDMMLEAAKVCDYRPKSVAEYMAIEYIERKLLMECNQDFFNHCITLCAELVSDYINSVVEFIADEYSDEYDVTEIRSLDDLLRCGYYGDDYESSREEFAGNFVEDVGF